MNLEGEMYVEHGTNKMVTLCRELHSAECRPDLTNKDGLKVLSPIDRPILPNIAGNNVMSKVNTIH